MKRKAACGGQTTENPCDLYWCWKGQGLLSFLTFFFNPKYNEGLFESFKHEWRGLICFREWQAKERHLNI